MSKKVGANSRIRKNDLIERKKTILKAWEEIKLKANFDFDR